MTSKNIKLDHTPTGEEEQAAFSDPDGFRKHLDNRSFAQDITERKTFARRAHRITLSWIGFLVILTFAQFILKKSGYGLSEVEFNVVFSTTTASVFGFWWLVGKYLFNAPPPNPPKQS